MNKFIQTIFLVFIASFNLRLGIASISPLLPLIKSNLHISNFQASLLTSLPVLCIGLFALFISFFERKFGKKNSIVMLLILLSLATFSRIFLIHYAGLFSSAFLIGCSVALLGPLLSGFIKQEFPLHAGLLIGIYSLALGMGATFASGCTLLMTHYFNGNWSIALASWGILSLFSALFWKLFAPWDALIKENQVKQRLHIPLKNRTAWKMALFFGIQSGLFYSIVTWLVAYFNFKEIENKNSILFLTFFTASQMVFSFIIPTVMDKYGRLSTWIVICSAGLFIGTLLLWLGNSLIVFLFALLLLAIGLGGLFPIALLLPMKYVHSSLQASLWTAMTQSDTSLEGLSP